MCIRDSSGPALVCPSGAVNITGAPAADPTSGVVFIPSNSGCTNLVVLPAEDSSLEGPAQTGLTLSRFAALRGAGGGRNVNATLDGIPIWKGPVGRISAVDVNTGEYKWIIPNGDALQQEQDLLENHPLLQGIDGVMTNRGRPGHAAMVATGSLLVASGLDADSQPKLFGIDKETGERVGEIELPGPTRYGMSSWVHEGKQYIIIQLNDGLAAYALP